MGDAGYFRGTSAEQDNRFSDKEKKLMKQMRFADSLHTRIDMTKVKLDSIKPWITQRVTQLLGMEDDVLNEFIINQLESEKNPDGKRIQINVTGFLNGKNARIFMGELWDLLISAQESSVGIPASILEAKKAEIQKRTDELEELRKSTKLVSDEKEARTRLITANISNSSKFPDKTASRSSGRRSRSRSHSPDNNRGGGGGGGGGRATSRRSRSRTPERSNKSKYNRRSVTPPAERGGGRSRRSRSRSTDRDRNSKFLRRSRSGTPPEKSSSSNSKGRRSRTPDRGHRSPSPAERGRRSSPIPDKGTKWSSSRRSPSPASSRPSNRRERTERRRSNEEADQDKEHGDRDRGDRHEQRQNHPVAAVDPDDNSAAAAEDSTGKKRKKKNKKHKKHKKSRKSGDKDNNNSGNSDEGEDQEDGDESPDEVKEKEEKKKKRGPPSPAPAEEEEERSGIEPRPLLDPPAENLEKILRARALESLKAHKGDLA